MKRLICTTASAVMADIREKTYFIKSYIQFFFTIQCCAKLMKCAFVIIGNSVLSFFLVLRADFLCLKMCNDFYLYLSIC